MHAHTNRHRSLTRLLLLLFLACIFTSCVKSTMTSPRDPGDTAKLSANQYLQSGTIILSRSVPPKLNNQLASAALAGTGLKPLMAPLIGYIPPTVGFVPAENETWLEINREKKALVLYTGKAIVKRLDAEGSVTLEPGIYALQNKQKRPLWYASNEYYTRRNISAPPEGDKSRYLRGALGYYVIYPTQTFPIHSSPLWNSDVGGIRLSRADLLSIYYMLPIGSTVVVK